MILLNFFSRFAPQLPWIGNNNGLNSSYSSHCCRRLNSYKCFQAEPKLSRIDLGAVIFKLQDFWNQNTLFADVESPCTGCNDGILVETFVNRGLSYKVFESEKCSFHHNPNPVSCSEAGSVWLDYPDPVQQTCQRIQNLLVKDFSFHKYYDIEIPCLCKV